MSIKGLLIRALGVHTFMDDEVLSVFFMDESVTAVRTSKAYRGSNLFTRNESLSTDLALELPMSPVVVIDVMVGSTAQRADSILGNGFYIPALNGF